MASLHATFSKLGVILTVAVGGVFPLPQAAGQATSPPPQRPPQQRQGPPPSRPPAQQQQQQQQQQRQGPPARQGQSGERPQSQRPNGPPQRGQGGSEGSNFGRPGDRGDRSDRSDRSDRFNRFDRSDRADRSDGYSGRWEREARGERENRGEREARGERGERVERGARAWGGSGALPARPDTAEGRRRVQPPELPSRPRALPRLVAYPRFNFYWGSRFRSIQNEIMFASRRGYIPVTAIPGDVFEVTDYSDVPAGWRGYGIVVPPGESLTINLDHANRPWFRLIICDSWGQAVPGGLSSLLPQFEPKLTYTNPGDTQRAIYLIVDDPGWMSSDGNPYVLQLARSWNPVLVPVDQGLIVAGIWGMEKSTNARFSRPMFVMPGFR